jgi:uncharacterized protein YbbK (DUF523 family)
MSGLTREERVAALREASVVLVSACLLGEACRYDAKSKGSHKVIQALEGKEVVPVCPETGAGLGIPRPAVELKGGAGAEVLAGLAAAAEVESGKDQTKAFLLGAELALAAARRFGVRVALLKERSPSCGTQGTHVDGRVVRGQGVTAALLAQSGLIVVSDEDL